MAHLTGLLCNTHEDKRVEQTLNLAASVCKLGAVQHVQATQRCIDFLWDCVCRVKRKDAGVFSAMAQEKVRRKEEGRMYKPILVMRQASRRWPRRRCEERRKEGCINLY